MFAVYLPSRRNAVLRYQRLQRFPAATKDMNMALEAKRYRELCRAVQERASLGDTTVKT